MKSLSVALLSLAIIGLAGSASLSGILINNQIKYNNLNNNFQELQNSFTVLENSFSSLQLNYTSLEGNYSILFGELDELDDLYIEICDSYQELYDDFLALNETYNQLNQTHNVLSNDFSDLLDLYTQLQSVYSQLLSDYASLNSLYVAISSKLSTILNYLQRLPFAEKMSIYYQFCRLYCEESTLETCRRIMLHASKQANYFTAIDNLLGPMFFDFDSSMNYAWDKIIQTFSSLQYWSGTNTQYTIHNWIRSISGLTYISDTISGFGSVDAGDYALSPIETLKYGGGDCEDFSILCGTMLENNGHDVGIVGIIDYEFYYIPLKHAWLWVNIDYNYWLANSINNPIWTFDGITYEWIVVDPTPNWQTSIWERPTWLNWYMTNGITPSQWLSKCQAVVINP